MLLLLFFSLHLLQLVNCEAGKLFAALRVAVDSNTCRAVNIYAAFQQILRFVRHNRWKSVENGKWKTQFLGLPLQFPLCALFAMQK